MFFKPRIIIRLRRTRGARVYATRHCARQLRAVPEKRACDDRCPCASLRAVAARHPVAPDPNAETLIKMGLWVHPPGVRGQEPLPRVYRRVVTFAPVSLHLVRFDSKFYSNPITTTVKMHSGTLTSQRNFSAPASQYRICGTRQVEFDFKCLLTASNSNRSTQLPAIRDNE